ncbi:MAG: phosphomannomutase/phosphoglucomutase [Gammaproteobacteria bacterium]
MARIFTMLGAVAVLAVLLAGGGVYWLSLAKVERAHRDSLNALSRGVSLSVSTQIEQINTILDNAAQNPELVEAILMGDRSRIAEIADVLEKLTPGALKIRILFPETAELDDSEEPHLGYADLEMVREAAHKDPLPMIQGDSGPNRHLAVARGIRIEDRVAAVILASLKYDFLKRSLKSAHFENGLIELKQKDLVLAFEGDKSLDAGEGSERFEAAGTAWTVQAWSPFDYSYLDYTLLAAILVVLSLAALLAVFFGYRRLGDMMRKDLSSILNVTKDLITGKLHRNYPVFLDEMRVVISSIVQYKRIVDEHEGIEGMVTGIGDDEDLELSNFFNDVQVDEGSITAEKDNAVVVGDAIEPESGSKSAGIGMSRPMQTADFLSDEPEREKKEQPAVKQKEAKSDPFAAVFRAYDIRGVAGKTLTKESVCDIGRAVGSEIREKGRSGVVIGRDGRTSGEVLKDALVQGLISTGIDVLDLGVIPTPVLYFVAHHHEYKSGIMITGSHNPPEYNGFKIVIDGETFQGEKIQRIRQRIEARNYASGGQGTLESNSMFVNEYIGVISEDVHIARPMKVAVDCGNGAAGELAPTLLKTLGCEVIELYCDIDGTFPHHHPDPSRPENLQDLIAAVQHYEADVGIAFDGDGDRIGVVDSMGKIIWPDRQMMMYAKDVLSMNPGSEIIFDVKCSRHLADQIVKHGGRPLMWKTGHSNMKAKLKETAAKLAGEMSGHIFFNDRWYGFDDALYAASRLVEILSADTRTSHEVFMDFPDSVNTPELNVETEEGENFRLVDKLIEKARFPDGKINKTDGLRVDFTDGWGLVRASNTTPTLVIRFEADNQKAMDRIMSGFRELLEEVKPGIALPF